MANYLSKQNIFVLCKKALIGFWYQHPKQKVITVPTRTILHPRLDVTAITDIHDIPKSVCNRTKAKIHIKTSYMSD